MTVSWPAKTIVSRRSQDRLWEDCVDSLKLWRVAWFLAKQDVGARFRRSHLGPFWILLNLGIWVGGVGIVYGLMFGLPASQFLPQLMAGIVIWAYVSASLLDSCHSFVAAQGYITQFAFPKQIHILRNWLGQGIIFFAGLSTLLILLLALGQLTISGLSYSVAGLIIVFLVSLGHNAVFAYVGARYRDLPHALGGVLQIVFLVTPIVFPVSLLKNKGLEWVYQFNPIYYLIDVIRHPLLTGDPAALESYFGSFAYLTAVWCLAIIVVRKLDRKLVFLL